MEFDDQDLQLLNNICENGNYLEDADDDIRNQGKSLKPSVWYLLQSFLQSWTLVLQLWQVSDIIRDVEDITQVEPEILGKLFTGK